MFLLSISPCGLYLMTFLRFFFVLDCGKNQDDWKIGTSIFHSGPVHEVIRNSGPAARSRGNLQIGPQFYLIRSTPAPPSEASKCSSLLHLSQTADYPETLRKAQCLKLAAGWSPRQVGLLPVQRSNLTRRLLPYGQNVGSTSFGTTSMLISLLNFSI